MQPFYARGGFGFMHRNLRMAGTGQVATRELDGDLRLLRDLPMEQVATFDRRHFGFARTAFLERWINPTGGLRLGIVDDGTLKSMGVVRPCQNGFKVGPLFAEDSPTANRLWVALSNHAAAKPVFLDIPENNPEAVALAERHQFEEVFGCARMYHGSIPELPWSNICGVSTFELG